MRFPTLVVLLCLLFISCAAQIPEIKAFFDEQYWKDFRNCCGSNCTCSSGRRNITGLAEPLQFYNGSNGGPQYGLALIPNARSWLEVSALSLSTNAGTALFIDGLNCGPFEVSVPASFQTIQFLYTCYQNSLPVVITTYEDGPNSELFTENFTLSCTAGVHQFNTPNGARRKLLKFAIADTYVGLKRRKKKR
jgi:hypothetical protein